MSTNNGMDHLSINRQSCWILLGGIVCLDLLCAGVTSIVITPFAWRPLLGVVLIGQTIFFMMIMLGIARLTPLEANHPSFHDGAPAALIIARMEQIRVRFIVGDILAGVIALLLGVVCLVLPMLSLADLSNWRPLIFAVSLVILPLGCALIAHSFTLIHRQSAQEYARQRGTLAKAMLLKVTNTGINQLTRAFDKGRLYILELQVVPAIGTPYHVSLRQLIRLHPANMPAIGSMIPIKYLPDQPHVVVALLDPGERTG